MNRVVTLSSEVAQLQSCLDCRSICITAPCLGYRTAEKLREVKELMEQGNGFARGELVRPRAPDAVEEVPFETSSSSLVGAPAKIALQEIKDHMMDDEVGIIGICGMGGTGKTTLLKIINNEFLQEEVCRRRFDVAIFVTVSRDVNISSIQKTIGERVEVSLSNNGDNDSSDRVKAHLLRRLSGKQFVLLLDDVWQELNLSEIGIPCPKEKRGGKIIFTTRSEEVCNGIGADRTVNVSLLDDESSWELFKSKVGNRVDVDDSEIGPLARQVVAKCGGLPISLITVGKAMANARFPVDWRNAIGQLDLCAQELSGMEVHVLAPLKFSYDMLKDETLRSCLSYCALFPEDYDIPKGQIIDYWMSEGFLEGEDDPNTHIDVIREKGHSKIKELRSVCLLEDDGVGDQGVVRLHDTILDMVLWINHKEFLVISGERQVPPREKWTTANRISFMRNRTTMGQIPYWEQITCENLTTLLASSGGLVDVPAGFFRSATTHRVLDLSHNLVMWEVPIEITNLVALQYLNLASTSIDSLPVQLGNLRELRQLILVNAIGLRKIPREAILPLSRLQVLKTQGSGYNLNSSEESEGNDPENLDWGDLEKMGSLCEMSVSVKSCPSMDRFLRSSTALKTRVKSLEIVSEQHDRHRFCVDIFARAINEPMQELRRLCLREEYLEVNPTQGVLTFSPGRLTSLEELNLFGLRRAKIVVDLIPNSRSGIRHPPLQSLQHLKLAYCHELTDLTWVGQLPSLKVMEISSCHGITDVLLDQCLPDDRHPIFPKLRRMELCDLAALRSISRHPLLFPSLEVLIVVHCPELKHLPLGPGSAEKLRVIRGEQRWWDNIEWDEDQMAVMSKFHDHFRVEAISCNIM